MNDTDKRLDALERSMRRQRVVIVGLVALLVVLSVGAGLQPTPSKVTEELRVKRLVVVDGDGKDRIVASAQPGGQISLAWFDAGGSKPLMEVSAGRLGASVVLSDTSGNGRWGITTLGTDLATMWMADKEGNNRLRASTLPSGNAYVAWLDHDNKERVSIATLADGNANLSWHDSDEKLRILTQVGADGPSIRLIDKAGVGGAVLGVGKSETPDGRITTYPEASLLLVGSDGKLLWRGPE